MHNVRRFLAVLLVLVSLTAYGAEMNNLGEYQWKNRLILGLVSNQATVSDGVERDVNELLAKVRSEDRVLLIGKDGGMKSRESSLDLDAIFRRIDAMPMRKREMRTSD